MTTVSPASYEERFRAAVNVIQNLPKNGPYQPSTSMMLKFYGLYKQATEGPAPDKKPSFWDIVGKAKWDAWNKNRNLSQEQAMQRYVEGLNEIIETMTFNENVQNFVGSMQDVNINLDDLELLAPGLKEKAISHPNSPFNSRSNSPHHASNGNASSSSSNGKLDSLSDVAVQETLTNGHGTTVLTNGHAVEENNNQVTPPTTPEPMHSVHYIDDTRSAVDQSEDEFGDPYDLHSEISEALANNTELLKQIQNTVLRMNADVAALQNRIQTLEKGVQDVRSAVVQKKATPSRSTVKASTHPKWWPFKGISPGWFLLLILWPFLVRRAGRMLSSPAHRK